MGVIEVELKIGVSRTISFQVGWICGPDRQEYGYGMMSVDVG